MATKISRFAFIAFALALICTTLGLSFLIYLFEYAYGNADGIWRDRNIIQATYKLLLAEALVILIVAGLFYTRKTVSYILFLTLFTLLLIFGLEKASLLIVNLQSKQAVKTNIISVERQDHELSVEPDSILGVKARRNASILWLPRNKNTRFDSVKINIDSLSRRITPASSDTFPDKYALFLGCSYTFGDGVSDDQTMPYYFQQNSPAFKAYNLGYLAYSPLHALARLQHESLERQVTEQDGVAIFTLINDHIDRVIPATRWIALTKGKLPYLNTETMQTEGLFADRRRVYTDMILGSETSGIKQLFKLGYPKYHTEKHYQLVIDILKKTEEEYIKRFKKNRFYVVIFPGNPLPVEMKKLLQDSKIKYFDYSGLTSTDDKMLPFDNAHPAPVLYKMVAKKLSEDLALIGGINN
ncbi:hypothetical protein [Dyadobacter aurulentus]|uniref:hypothetical protein n=1 Tax=Dyadobacter sp. UC 10 TaxID=2605428 RepID=UPI0011F1AFBE|nr:hypothetical protein [Dyadobacter sp. UC 10]KAA0992726.1 hypothetical protein FXO21_22395 [Dyadobacter sp. UC 10]